ncbi:nucleotidyltransferase domain-containing protein [Candidatus Parvarchaeota archaeon]|nr:nucleotidyltransferase domain-containing protein [Candidatus Parvarchaeota archaeon]
MEKSDKRAIDSLISQSKKTKGVVAVVLFGSYAKSKETPISDIDLCIIDNVISKKDKNNLYAKSTDKVQVSIFSDLPVAVKFRVLKEGKDLFVADEEKLDSIRADTLMEFMDFRHVLDYYYKKVYKTNYEI